MSNWIKLSPSLKNEIEQGRPVSDSKAEVKPEKNTQVSNPVESKLRSQNVMSGKRNGKQSKGADVPPELECMPVIRSTLRFYAGAAVGTRASPRAITSVGIFGALGGYGVATNATIRSFASAFRIRRVTVYPAQGTTDNSDVELTWNGDANLRFRPSVPDRSLPQGTLGAPRKAVFVPPKQSLSAFWFTGAISSTTMFYLFMGASGGILDLELDWCLYNGVNAALSQSNMSATTVTIGTVYYTALDETGSSDLQPVGRYPTTT